MYISIYRAMRDMPSEEVVRTDRSLGSVNTSPRSVPYILNSETQTLYILDTNSLRNIISYTIEYDLLRN